MVTCFSLHPGPGGDLHLSLPDELRPAGPAVPGALHPPAHHPRGLAQGRPARHVGGRHQGDITSVKVSNNSEQLSTNVLCTLEHDC